MLRKNLNSMTPGRLASRAGRGFTLMEMVVGVGAVALVAVGLAAIFDSVGKTVSGGRRVSVVNTYASLIESQLRRDFASMSRDGFLIIRNQWVDTNNNGTLEPGYVGNPAGDKVRVSEDQSLSDARGHRIDEIQFVVTGKYRSSRQALHPDVQAESNEAVLYIGHGLMAPATGLLSTGTPAGYKKSVPAVNDTNAGTLGFGVQAPPGQPDNPNQFSKNWMLLRHVTLLANQDASQSLPLPASANVYGYQGSTAAGYHRLRNRPTQFMLQPAASSLFRSVATTRNFPATGAPETPTPDNTIRYGAITGEGYYPDRASGIVDIASGSLADLRAVVNTCQLYPAAGGAWPAPLQRTLNPVAAGAASNTRPSTFTDLDRMHAYLNDLMPTESRNPDTAAIHGDFPASGGQFGTRIRYEDGPTDLLASMALASTTPTATDLLVQAQRRADQMMLSSSNFVPHCTDFHVEWSFGLTDEFGQTLWHGLPTPRTYYKFGSMDAPTEEPRPYPWSAASTSDNRQHPYVLAIGTGNDTHTVTPRLIYGFTPGAGGVDESELTSYFGWIDPTYGASGTVPVDELTTGIVPWAWPKLVRVTIMMVDPIDPTIESTFQYIFDVPEKQGLRAQ